MSQNVHFTVSRALVGVATALLLATGCSMSASNSSDEVPAGSSDEVRSSKDSCLALGAYESDAQLTTMALTTLTLIDNEHATFSWVERDMTRREPGTNGPSDEGQFLKPIAATYSLSRMAPSNVGESLLLRLRYDDDYHTDRGQPVSTEKLYQVFVRPSLRIVEAKIDGSKLVAATDSTQTYRMKTVKVGAQKVCWPRTVNETVCDFDKQNCNDDGDSIACIASNVRAKQGTCRTDFRLCPCRGSNEVCRITSDGDGFCVPKS